MKRDVTLPEPLKQRFERLYEKAMSAELIPTQDSITFERTRLNVFMENLGHLFSLSTARVEGVVKKFHRKEERPTDQIDREILGFYEASLLVIEGFEKGFVLSAENCRKRYEALARYHEVSESSHFKTENDKREYRKKDAMAGGDSITGQRQQLFYADPKNIAAEIDKLDEWANAQLAQNANPLIVAAIYHVEFEAIHPWVDENGRDGRLRIYEMLGKQLSLNGNLLLEEFILQGTSKFIYIMKMNAARGVLNTEPVPFTGYPATLDYEKISQRDGNAAIFLEYFADIYENALNKALALQPAVHRELA